MQCVVVVVVFVVVLCYFLAFSNTVYGTTSFFLLLWALITLYSSSSFSPEFSFSFVLTSTQTQSEITPEIVMPVFYLVSVQVYRSKVLATWRIRCKYVGSLVLDPNGSLKYCVANI